MTRENFKRPANLPDKVRKHVLDRLDRGRAGNDAEGRENEQRSSQRFAYRVNDLAMIVDHPGGGSSRMLMFSRNISSGGASFIHNAFCHPGSACRVLLRRQNGEGHVVSARIVACRHITGLLHEISVKFDSPVHISEFVANTDQQHETANATGAISIHVDTHTSEEDRKVIENIIAIGERAGTMLNTLASAAPVEHINATTDEVEQLHRMSDDAIRSK